MAVLHASPIALPTTYMPPRPSTTSDAIGDPMSPPFKLGPFWSESQSEIRLFGVDSGSRNVVRIYRIQSNGTVTSAAFYTGASGAFVESIWAEQVGTTVHVAAFILDSSGMSPSAEVRYLTHDLTASFTGTPVISESVASGFNPVPATLTRYRGCALGVRSDGTPVIIYSSAAESVMGTGYGRVSAARRTGTNTWTINTITNTGDEQSHGPSMVRLFPNDNMQLFCHRTIGFTSYIASATLTAGNTLTAITIGDWTSGGTPILGDSHVPDYGANATTRVRVFAHSAAESVPVHRLINNDYSFVSGSTTYFAVNDDDPDSENEFPYNDYRQRYMHYAIKDDDGEIWWVFCGAHATEVGDLGAQIYYYKTDGSATMVRSRELLSTEVLSNVTESSSHPSHFDVRWLSRTDASTSCVGILYRRQSENRSYYTEYQEAGPAQLVPDDCKHLHKSDEIIVAPVIPTPQNLTATPVSDTQIDLNWDDVGGVDYYGVERDGQIIATPAVSNYSDTGLTPATLYTYRVRAVKEI